MSLARPPVALLDRLRGATALRVLLLLTALLASQNSLACAVEEAYATTPASLSVPAPDADAQDGCCALCTDCAHQGGCCHFASTSRAGGERFVSMSLHDARPWPDDSARLSWTPPTLLKPPITAV
jgi:hypothetical protein